jgi:hypothetical protein
MDSSDGASHFLLPYSKGWPDVAYPSRGVSMLRLCFACCAVRVVHIILQLELAGNDLEEDIQDGRAEGGKPSHASICAFGRRAGIVLDSRDGALHKFPVVEVVASRRSRPSRCPRGMLLSKPGFAVCVWASCQGIDMDSSAEASHNCAHVRSVVFAVAYCSVRSYGHRASQLTRSGPSRCPRWVWRFRPRLRSVLGPRDRHRCG